MSRQATDREEYDEAVSIIQWLQARAREMVAAGDVTSAQRIAVTTLTIADVFLLPPAGTVRERVKAWLAKGNESAVSYMAEKIRVPEAETLAVLEMLRDEGQAECVGASKLWRRVQ